MRLDRIPEAMAMMFSIPCPNDGAVEVGLEDIESIVVRDEDNVEVLFTCPRCGDRISVSAQVPHVLLTALEEVWSGAEQDEAERAVRFTAVVSEVVEEPERVAEVTGGDHLDDAHIDHYCEYFRRQLADIGSVDAMLSEIDGR
jgi:hypothetical protein